MNWVFESKSRKGRMEIRTTWLPYFLASDSKTLKLVESKLTEKFKGQADVDLKDIDKEIIDIITGLYDIEGLDKLLRAIHFVNLDSYGTEKEKKFDKEVAS